MTNSLDIEGMSKIFCVIFEKETQITKISGIFLASNEIGIFDDSKNIRTSNNDAIYYLKVLDNCFEINTYLCDDDNMKDYLKVNVDEIQNIRDVKIIDDDINNSSYKLFIKENQETFFFTKGKIYANETKITTDDHFEKMKFENFNEILTKSQEVKEPVPEVEKVKEPVPEVEEVKAPVPIEEVKAPVPEVEKVKEPVPEVEEVKAPVPIEEVKAPVPIEEVKAPVPKVEKQNENNANDVELKTFITNNMSQLNKLLIEKLKTEDADLKQLLAFIKKRKGGHFNTGGASPTAITDETNIYLNDYIELVKYITTNPIILKISSITTENFIELFEKGQLLDSDINNELDISSKEKMKQDLIKFMYIDIAKILTEKEQKFFIKNFIITEEFEKNKNNYNAVTNNQNDVKLIYINKFISIFDNFIKNFTSMGTRSDTQFLRWVILTKLIQYIRQNVGLLKIIIERYIPIFTYDQNIEFNTNVDNYIKFISNNNIITFLKLRNDESRDYNRRFDIKLNANLNDKPPITEILIGYNNDDIKYYDFTDKGQVVIPEGVIDKLGGNIDISNTRQESGVISFNKYDKQYLFGKFSNIFLPKMNNESIAKKMDVIREKLTLENPKPVFIIGYGASGAGKTSSLIYFKNTLEDGVLINLCNQLGGEYDTVNINCKEFYHSTDSGSEDEPIILSSPPDNGSNIEFKYDETEKRFLLSKEYLHKNNHYLSRFKKGGNSYDTTTKFENKTPLGEVLIHIIDTDRFVKATTNNPNSSRSHTLVFVKLINSQTNKSANIIVGDFAGVENKFDCADTKVIDAFSNIKRDDNSSNSGKPFYSSELIKENRVFPDPIGSATNKKDGMDSKCFDSLKSTADVYNFDPNTKIFDDAKLQEKWSKEMIPIVNSFNRDITKINYFFEYLYADSKAKFLTGLNTSDIEKGRVIKKIFDDGDNLIKINDGGFKFLSDTNKIKTGSGTYVSNTNHITFISNETNKKLYKELKEKAFEKIKESSCKIESSKIICNNRTEEGYFINKSLQDVRNTIKKILIEKNKTSMNLVPNFIDICLENYCPSHDNCFSTIVGDSNSSIIFKTIQNELGYADKTGDFYKDIIVSIFCVLNISRKANNPPPIPYIDTNELKQFFYYNDLLNEKDDVTRKEFINASKLLIENIEKRDKLENLKQIKDSKNENIYEFFKEVIELFEKNDVKSIKSDWDKYKSHIEDFINMIDNNSAVSAIGTIEFLDQVAKFNTVTTNCQNGKYLPDQEISDYVSNFVNIIDDFIPLDDSYLEESEKNKKKMSPNPTVMPSINPTVMPSTNPRGKPSAKPRGTRKGGRTKKIRGTKKHL